MITGGEGIIDKASNARDTVEISEEKDQISIAVVEAIGKNKIGNLEKDELQNVLDKTFNKSTTVIEDGNNIVVKVEDRYYIIDSNNNILGPEYIVEDEYAGDFSKGGKYDGKSEQNAYKINCIEDLVELSKQSNIGNKYDGYFFELTRNLDFNSIFSYSNYKTTKYDEFLGGDGTTELKTQLSANGNGFMPIYFSQYLSGGFCGNFNGNNNKIENIYINYKGTPGNYGAGLFGMTSNDAIIRNLTVSGNVKTETKLICGGIVGYALKNSIIENCYNYCNVETSGTAGGIVGNPIDTTVKIINCGNYGKVTVIGNESYSSAGGIAGLITNIKNCFNQGEIVNSKNAVYHGAGGIVGNAKNLNSEVENCYNTGSVAGQYSQGAIVGGVWYNTLNSTLNTCYYLNSSCNNAVGGRNITEGTISCDEKYMKDGSMLEELNEFVESYNNEHKDEDGFIKLKKWIQVNGEYPILDIND